MGTETNTKETIDNKFKEEFNSFLYPFKTADQLIEKMPDGKKQEYYRWGLRLRDDKRLNNEMNEICRVFYHKLAMEEDKEKRMLYKGAMLFAKRWKLRFAELASRDAGEKDKAMEKAEESMSDIYK